MQFIHAHCPLTRVLGEAHDLLDEVAKKQCGRDGLVVRVVKPGGAVLQWAMPWKKALAEDQSRLEIQRFAERFKIDKDGDEGFSSKFFYGVRELFSQLALTDGQGKPVGHIPGPDEFVRLLWTDYVASGLNGEGKTDFETMRPELEALYQQCLPKKRKLKCKAEFFWPAKVPRPDAALLIRFLATSGCLA